ncbi:MAG: hypothetical protein N3A57_04680 [Negativicutes bacterium]|nr:hypothetical protein [Negativicutes bacterium]
MEKTEDNRRITLDAEKTGESTPVHPGSIPQFLPVANSAGTLTSRVFPIFVMAYYYQDDRNIDHSDKNFILDKTVMPAGQGRNCQPWIFSSEKHRLPMFSVSSTG